MTIDFVLLVLSLLGAFALGVLIALIILGFWYSRIMKEVFSSNPKTSFYEADFRGS